MSTSLWLAGREPLATDPTSRLESQHFDTVVVGAGMTGLSTAVMLARAGQRVLVVDSQHPGAGTTGSATGQVTVLHGNRIGRIVRRHGPATAASFLRSNLDGLRWLVDFCEETGVDLQARRAVSYSQTGQGLDGLKDDLRALEAAGLEAESLGPTDLDLPFCFAGGIAVPNQYQFDPMDFLAAAVEEVRRLGGMVVSNTRLLGVASGPIATVVLGPAQDPQGTNHPRAQTIRTRRVVMAARMPVPGDRTGRSMPARPVNGRSYAVAFHSTDPATADYPRDMFVSVDGPSRSLRTALPGDGIERLVVGGGNLQKGRNRDAPRVFSEIEEWTLRAFPGMVRTHAWSAEDYDPIRGFPVAGPDSAADRPTETVLVASGYAKWGMTNSVAASLKVARLATNGSRGPEVADVLRMSDAVSVDSGSRGIA